jgi:hypothetical protein
VLLTAYTINHEKNQVATVEQSANQVCDYCNANFWVKNYVRTHFDGTFEPFNFKADELIKRQRKGRIMTFNDYDELYINGLLINQPLKTKIVKFDMNEMMSIDSNKLTGDDNSDTNSKLVNQSTYQILGNRLNRILVDKVRINFKPNKKPPIVLTAKSAKMLTDTMIMRFEGDVVLEATKCKISSQVAVWSNVNNGLFLSEAYRYNNRTYKTPAFFQITDDGRCKKVRPTHRVEEYVDNLDIFENKLLESIPESTGLLFGLMGTSIN